MEKNRAEKINDPTDIQNEPAIKIRHAKQIKCAERGMNQPDTGKYESMAVANKMPFGFRNVASNTRGEVMPASADIPMTWVRHNFVARKRRYPAQTARTKFAPQGL
jgi:hypothetical protein